MAFSGNFMCTSFKQELLQAKHDFTNSSGDTYKLAMYTNSASFNAATTAYTTSNEISGTGYSAGGGTLTNVTPTTSGTTALTDFADLTFSSSTLTARGALIYNTQVAGAEPQTQLLFWILVLINPPVLAILPSCSQLLTHLTLLFGLHKNGFCCC